MGRMKEETVHLRTTGAAVFHLESTVRENHTACGRSTLNTKWNDGWVQYSRDMALRLRKRECKACFRMRTK